MAKNSVYNKTVVVAMSGGVDSSVAAALLKEEGYSLIGVTLKTWGFDDFPEKDSGCCSLETIYNAKNVSEQLGFPHYTLDFTERFNETVITNFIDEYMKGHTPNPCVLCNKVIKWGALLEKAESLGADYIATGHYAKLRYNENSKRYNIAVSGDNKKDQTYALWRLSQYALSKTLFPLSHFNKTKIREIAKEMNLKPAETPDSQEICFVPDNNYRELLQIRVPDLDLKYGNGDIIYKGNRIGKHKGFAYYTIGQRKGLNVSLGKPVYVSKIDAENNIVFVDDENYLYNPGFITKEINLMLYEKLDKPVSAKVKIRYKDEGSDAIVEQVDDERIKVIFNKPKKSITPGQSAVFYIGEDVLGGGIIDEVIS
ncbi:MAG TPA: tRNA 2-thiouridine(34) synthase MnmA [Ignavibacteria bacterium]